MSTLASSSPSLPAATIVSGFLGAGKTTWLNRVLTEPRGLRVAIVVNDVGEINIDAALLSATQPSANGTAAAKIVGLSNGCVCCTVRDDLAETVAELAASGNYDHIVVECSGVSEPRLVAGLFTERNQFGRSLGQFARLHALITLVDAAHFLAESRRRSPTGGSATQPFGSRRPLFDLMLEQVECADVVILNKTDRASVEERAEVHALITHLNGRAEIHEAQFGAVATEVWPGSARFQPKETPKSATWMRVLDTPQRGAAQGLARVPLLRPPPPAAESYASKYGLGTWLYSRRAPLREMALRALFERGIPGLVRAKGFFWSVEQPDDLGFLSLAGGAVRLDYPAQWVAALVTKGVLREAEIPASIRAFWVPPFGDRRQEIVFIGVGLDATRLEADLDTCLEGAPQHDPQHPAPAS